MTIENFFYEDSFFKDLDEFLDYLEEEEIEKETYEIFLTDKVSPFQLTSYGIIDNFMDTDLDLFEDDYIEELSDFLKKKIDFDELNENLPKYFSPNGNMTIISHPFLNNKNQVEVRVIT